MEILVAGAIIVAIFWWLGTKEKRKTAESARPSAMFVEAPRTQRPRTPRAKAAFDVVGEASYQGALENVCGGRSEDEADFPCEATLVPEPTNKYDSAAVRVEVNGQLVGYLSRPSAKQYAPIAEALGKRKITAPARIVGGWKRSRSDWGHFGIVLSLPAGPELLKEIQEGRR